MKKLLLILALLFVNRAQAACGIAVDLTSSSGSFDDTVSWTHTTGILSNGMLVVGVQMYGGGTVSSITYGGIALTSRKTQTSADGSVRGEIWTLASPASGAGTVLVTTSGATVTVAGAVTYSGVASIGNLDSATNVDMSISDTFTTANNFSWVASIVGQGNAGATIVDGTNITSRWTGGQGAGAVGITADQNDLASNSAGNYALTYDFSGSLGSNVLVEVELVPSCASTATFTPTITQTFTLTATPTNTPVYSPTTSPTHTFSPTLTATPTFTPTITVTYTTIPTATPGTNRWYYSSFNAVLGKKRGQTWSFKGSDAYPVTVMKIVVYATGNDVQPSVSLLHCTSAPTGTGVVFPSINRDGSQAAATAVNTFYPDDPTSGTIDGPLKASMATVTGPKSETAKITWDFTISGELGGKVLYGSNDTLVVTFNGFEIASASYEVEFIEGTQVKKKYAVDQGDGNPDVTPWAGNFAYIAGKKVEPSAVASWGESVSISQLQAAQQVDSQLYFWNSLTGQYDPADASRPFPVAFCYATTTPGKYGTCVPTSTFTPGPPPLPSGAATEATLLAVSAKFGSLGQKAMAGSAPVVIASDQSPIPVSQSGTWNITNISGTISLPTGASTSANQTSELTKLDTLNTDLAPMLYAQAANTSGQTGPLIMGAVTTAAPSYTTTKSYPFSMNTSGGLRVDGSGVTQPVSGTFWQATQPVSGTFWQATQPVSGTFWQATQPVSIAATVTVAGAKTNNNAAPGATNVGALVAVAQAAAPSQTEGNLVALRTNLAGDVAITLDGEIPAVSQSGTWNIGTVTTLTGITNALPAGTNGIGKLTTNTGVDIGSVSGLKTNNSAVPAATNLGVLSAIANAADKAYTEGNQVLLRTTLAGDLAITLAGEAVVLGAGSASIGTLGANSGVDIGDVNVPLLELAQASTTAAQVGPLMQGAVTTAAPAYTTAKTNPLSLSTEGALRSQISQVGDGNIQLVNIGAGMTYNSGRALPVNSAQYGYSPVSGNFLITYASVGSRAYDSADVEAHVRANLMAVGGVALSTSTGASGTGTIRTDSNLSLSGVAVISNDGVAGTGTIRMTQAREADYTMLASGSRTTTQNGADQTNNSSCGVEVTVDVTVAGTGSISMTIQGKDTISGKYYTLLAGGAITTNSTNTYRVDPSTPAVANVNAQRILPRVWRIAITANNANAVTYSVGATFLHM